MPVVDAVVLAAGASSRAHPVQKLTADLDGRPVIAWVLAALHGVRDVVVVTSGDPAVEALLGNHRVARNPRPEDGMSRSLAIGIEALRPGADAVLQVLGDMPFVREEDVAALIAVAGPDRVVVPVHDGERGHPVVWGASFVPFLLALDGASARDVLDGAPHIEDVAIDHDGVLFDVDTPEALDEARRRVGRRLP